MKNIITLVIISVLFNTASHADSRGANCSPDSGDANFYFLCLRQQFSKADKPEVNDFANVNSFNCKSVFGPYSRLSYLQPAEILPDTVFNQAKVGQNGWYFIRGGTVQTYQQLYLPMWESLSSGAGALAEKTGNLPFGNDNARLFQSFRVIRATGQLMVEFNVKSYLTVDGGNGKTPLYSGTYAPIAPPSRENWDFNGTFNLGYRLCTPAR